MDKHTIEMLVEFANENWSAFLSKCRNYYGIEESEAEELVAELENELYS